MINLFSFGLNDTRNVIKSPSNNFILRKEWDDIIDGMVAINFSSALF